MGIGDSIDSLLQRLKEDGESVHTVYVYFLFPFLALVGYLVVFYVNLPWVLVFLFFGAIPKLDQILRHDWLNPTYQELSELEHNQKFRAVLYFTIFFDWVVFIRMMRYIYYDQYGLLELIPVTFMIIGYSGSVFLVSHELLHKLNKTDQIIGTLHQIKVLYMHFTVEHVHGHHKRVATMEDPATAIKGITLYEFVPKSIKGGFLSAFNINPLFTSLSVVGSLLFIAGVYNFYGLKCTLYACFMAAGGIFFLELINYIEHYGLMRKKLPDGTYEKVTIRHSWNAPHRISNYLTFKVQRHSDHHENSTKPYQMLCTYEDSPQLPHGYLVCLMIACSPKVSHIVTQHWFAMMNPLVDEYSKTEKGTNLKELAEAEKKADDFMDRLYLFTASMMILEIFLKYGI